MVWKFFGVGLEILFRGFVNFFWGGPENIFRGLGFETSSGSEHMFWGVRIFWDKSKNTFWGFLNFLNGSRFFKVGGGGGRQKFFGFWKFFWNSIGGIMGNGYYGSILPGPNIKPILKC